MRPADLVPGDKVWISSPTSMEGREASFVKRDHTKFYFEIPGFTGCGAGRNGLLSLIESNVRRYVRPRVEEEEAEPA